VYLVLLHFPIVNRKGLEVTTAVTNLDIHDIARSVRTYNLKGYFIVTPIEDQQELVGRILSHWKRPGVAQAHPDRAGALALVRQARSFSEVKTILEEEEGALPEVVLTDARVLPHSISYEDYRRELAAPSLNRPVVLVFGTGWGISPSFYPEVNRILAPIYGPEGVEGYNHLSVRSAVAIILDRLFGQ
jgi:hypothetical protein